MGAAPAFSAPAELPRGGLRHRLRARRGRGRVPGGGSRRQRGARRRPQVRRAAAGARQPAAANIPFRDEFDAIGCFDVLEHIADDSRVLQQCFLAVRPGGGVVLTVPQHPSLWSAADEYAGHVRRYTRAGIVGKVVAAGFRPLAVTSFVSLLFPLMAAARRRRRRLDAAYDPGAELEVRRLANLLLERALDFERLLIRLGARFPFGGSLLLVAEKPHVDPV
jgi:SAM-dependent methyltransferase